MNYFHSPVLIDFFQHFVAFVLIAVDTAMMFQVIEFHPRPMPGAPKLGKIPELK